MPLGLTTPTLIGGILLILSIGALFLRSKIANSIFATVPIGTVKTRILAAGIIGLIFGGIAIFPALWGWGTGFVAGFGGGTVASFVGGGAPTLPATEVDCIYKNAITVLATVNATVRADTVDDKVVYLDCDASGDGLGCPIETSAQYELVANFTCVRRGEIGEDASAEMVATSPNFLSETSPGTTTSYNILEIKTTKSSVFDDFVKEVYLTSDGTASTTAGDAEREYLVFTESQKEKTLTVTVEADLQSFAQLNNYTAKPITLYQRINGVDTEKAKIIINKVP